MSERTVPATLTRDRMRGPLAEETVVEVATATGVDPVMLADVKSGRRHRLPKAAADLIRLHVDGRLASPFDVAMYLDTEEAAGFIAVCRAPSRDRR